VIISTVHNIIFLFVYTSTGKHYVLLSNLADGVREVRTLMDELYLPLVPLFASGPSAAKYFESAQPASFQSASSLGLNLPVNVQLLTLEARSNSELLVRLAHQFAVGEDAALSAAVTVDLFALLAPFGPVSAQEMSLSANQLKADQLANKIQWPTASTTASAAATVGKAGPAKKQQLRGDSGAAGADASYPVQLSAMQIKTFLVKLK
jgi:hypothetical protein